ncbi:MAG: type II CAAX endopeptidase family protein [Bacteroidota bacterium]
MRFVITFIYTVVYCICLKLLAYWFFLIPIESSHFPLIEVYDTLNSLIMLIILGMVFTIAKRKDVLTFKKTESNYYLLGILLGIGFVFFQPILNIIYYLEFTTNFIDYEFTIERLKSLNILAYVIFIPIAEELFFRNFIQRELSKTYKPYLAILLASLLFAFMHITFENIFLGYYFFNMHQAYITLFGGFISGVLLYKSQSVVPSILFHVFWNLTVHVV